MTRTVDFLHDFEAGTGRHLHCKHCRKLPGASCHTTRLQRRMAAAKRAAATRRLNKAKRAVLAVYPDATASVWRGCWYVRIPSTLTSYGAGSKTSARRRTISIGFAIWTEVAAWEDAGRRMAGKLPTLGQERK